MFSYFSLHILRSETDLNRHWDISASLSPPSFHRQHLGNNKFKYNSHDTLEQNLSIEDAFDRAMSLPSSPTVKNAEDSFDSFEEDVVKKPRSSSEKTKKDIRDRHNASPSSSLGLGRKTFLDGLKIRARTKSGDNLFGEKTESLINGVSQSDEKLYSQTSKQVNYLMSRIIYQMLDQ